MTACSRVIRAWMVLLIAAIHIAGPARPVVALLTDFGLSNEAVGQCHGAILKVDSNIQVVDLCHSVDSYDIQLAALMLRGASAFPKGTVFVAVVDPGVGTRREAIAARTAAGYVFVGPNNGVLWSAIADQAPFEFVKIDPKRVNPDWEPGTFDGRDLFAPAGAIIAKAGGSLSQVGDVSKKVVLEKLELPVASYDSEKKELTGIFLRTDEPYGNLWTNISRDELTSAGLRLGDRLAVSFDEVRIEMPWVVSFGHVVQGEPLAYLNSSGTLAFAINMGNFVATHNLARGATVHVQKGSESGEAN